jgi:hypothetical protein
MANKYLKTASGGIAEQEALVTSAGAGDAGKIPALDAAGKLDNSLMPVGIGSDTASITSTENLTAGDIVNIYASTGAKVRKADATSAGKAARGYVLASTTSGAAATVYFEQIITGLSGLTEGATYWLSTTAGGVVATAPSGSGNVVQEIGVALSSTTLQFMPGPPITLA